MAQLILAPAFFLRVFFAFIALLTVRSPLPAAAATTIRVGYPQLNGGQTPLWNIADGKIDQKYGLDIKPVYIPGGVRLTQSMLSGSVDIAMTGGAAVNAMLSGAEFIYVGMPVATYAFSLYARPEIKSVTDLRGKILGVITKGASSDHAAIALLRQYKMTQQDMAVRRSAIQQSPDVIRGFLKAMVAGLRVSIEQPEISRRAIGKYLASKDQEIIAEAYSSFAALFPKVPYVTDEAIRAAVSVTDHPKAASANPKDFYDNRFLQELETSGFVKELYGAR